MIEIDWSVLLAVFATSLFVCVLVVLTERWHGQLTYDNDLNGVQKIHERPVPRIGGVVVMSGLCMGTLALYWTGSVAAPQMKHLLFCCAPSFLAGFWEDITKKVSIAVRLWASFLSASLAFFLVGAILSRLNVPWLDNLMQYWPIALFFTVFAVAGFINAINIIDGLNGLASGSVVFILIGLGMLGYRHNDLLVTYMCSIGIATLLGFMVLNYPFGRVFLGDGGAYLTGFWVAECAVLLLARNPSINTWLVLVICLYPVWETVFSMWRRIFIARTKAGQADQQHLHHLVMNHWVKARLLPLQARNWQSHGLSSPLLWLLVLMCQLGIWVFSEDQQMELVGGILFLLSYHLLYRWVGAQAK